jgi:putative membrane protein
MMSGYGMMAGMGWLGMVTMILFWIGILLLVIWGVSGLFPTNQRTTGPTALEILQQRYARGEISREEFEQARNVLSV